MMNNIILIGMPGSGKSTVGVLLAKILGFDFVDTDLVIQKEEGRRLCEIIEKEGADALAKIEEAVCKNLSCDKTVIATGGSAVLSNETMEHFGKMGKIVFLDVPLSILEKRVGDLDARGVVRKKGQSFEALFEERLPLYRKYADYTASAKADAGEMAKDIAEIVR